MGEASADTGLRRKRRRRRFISRAGVRQMWIFQQALRRRQQGRNMSLIQSAGQTDVGRKRKGNEDSHFVDDHLQLYVVADGMGGHKAGEVASKIVVETIHDYMRRFHGSVDAEELIDTDITLSKFSNRLYSSILLANAAVYQLAQGNPDYKGMGSTVSAVYITEEGVTIGNVGDSPVYRIRKGKIELVSVLHTVMAEQAALAPEGGRKLGEEYRHILTRAMGTKPTVQADISESDYRQDDIFVICSDGLSDLVKPKEIMVYALNFPPQDACAELTKLANERGGVDNITVIVFKVLNDSLPASTTLPTKEDVREAVQKNFKIEVEYDTEDESYQGYLQDISLSGGFIETNNAFSEGEELMVSMTINGQLLMLNATVARREPKGIFIDFGKLKIKEQRLLSSLFE